MKKKLWYVSNLIYSYQNHFSVLVLYLWSNSTFPNQLLSIVKSGFHRQTLDGHYVDGSKSPVESEFDGTMKVFGHKMAVVNMFSIFGNYFGLFLYIFRRKLRLKIFVMIIMNNISS